VVRTVSRAWHPLPADSGSPGRAGLDAATERRIRTGRIRKTAPDAPTPGQFAAVATRALSKAYFTAQSAPVVERCVRFAFELIVYNTPPVVWRAAVLILQRLAFWGAIVARGGTVTPVAAASARQLSAVFLTYRTVNAPLPWLGSPLKPTPISV
jgi:hypothetical protein